MSTTLDMMEYATDDAAQTAYVSSDGWNLLLEDCAGIADWTDNDKGVGVSEVDPAGQFRLDSNTSATPNDYASRYRDLASPPNKFTIEIKTYFDDIGTVANSDHFVFYYSTATWRFQVLFASDGLYITKTGAANVEVGTDIVKEGGTAAWQIWKFEVDKSGGEAAATVEVFLDDVSQGTFDCDYELAGTDGRCALYQFGYATNNMVSHIDYVKIGELNLQCYSESTIKQEGSYSLKGFAITTDSLNDTLTRTVSPTIDLSGIAQLVYRIYSGRTGSNIKLGIHDSGGTTTEHTASIGSANTWESQQWDISGVANADKDVIDQIIITVVNADADNTFYIDEFCDIWSRALTGTLAFTDAITKKTSRSLADTLAFTDAIAKKTKRALADTLAFSDSLVKKTKKALADTIAFTDSIGKKTKKALADTIAFTDAIAKKTKRSLADTIAFTDTITKKIKKVLADSISFVGRLFAWHEKGNPSSSWTEESDPDSSWEEE